MTWSDGWKGRRMCEKRLPDPPEVRRARHDRMDRLLEELRAANARKRAIVEMWRAEAGWPPLEPRRRF